MNKFIAGFLLLVLLLLVVSCQPQTETVEVITESESAEEAVEVPPSAIGSEDDSGALPPPINSGSKVTSSSGTIDETPVDVLFIIESTEDTVVPVAELEENWESTLQQISSLSAQPNARYATILFNPDEESSITFIDFTESPSWDNLMPQEQATNNNAANMTDVIVQLSWEELENPQIVFILVSPVSFDNSLRFESDRAVYYPIIMQDWELTEAESLNYEAGLEEVNGRLIELNNDNQTTLSEQIILAVAETISQLNEQ